MTMLDIIKAKLARGGQMNGGEIKLVVADIVKMFEAQQEQINELKNKLDAKPRGGRKGAEKSNPVSEVRSDADE